MHRKFLVILVLAGLSFSSFAGSRKLVEGHNFVGKLKYNYSNSCTAFLVRHGIVATAKHCFSHHEIDNTNFDRQKLIISFDDDRGEKLTLKNRDFQQLILDSGDNDIAYILYKKSKTRGKIFLNHLEISNTEIEIDQEVMHLGFPQNSSFDSKKILSYDCRFDGIVDYFPPTITDPGYQGLLFQTDCSAWKGDSGAPVFARDRNGKINIYGLLVHTFEVNFAGEIFPEAILSDSIGKYVKSSNFTSFSSSNFLDIF